MEKQNLRPGQPSPLVRRTMFIIATVLLTPFVGLALGPAILVGAFASFFVLPFVASALTGGVREARQYEAARRDRSQSAQPVTVRVSVA